MVKFSHDRLLASGMTATGKLKGKEKKQVEVQRTHMFYERWQDVYAVTLTKDLTAVEGLKLSAFQQRDSELYFWRSSSG